MVARLEGPDRPVNVLIVAKGNGQPRFARSAAQQLRRSTEGREDSYGLFIALYISERTARLLKETIRPSWKQQIQEKAQRHPE